MKIYADENVNPAVTKGLRRRGVQASCANEANNLGKTDAEQLEHATREQAILFTHDPDLLVLGRDWPAQGKEHWGVIYSPQDSLSIGECIRRLLDYVEILDAEDMKNRVEFL